MLRFGNRFARSTTIATRTRLQLLVGFAASLLLLGAVPARAAGPTPTNPIIANVQVSHDTYLAHSEPAVAENPKNSNNLIAGSKMFTDPAHYQFNIGTYYSRDGGKTWHDNGVLPGFKQYGLTSDVSFAFSKTGVAYVAVLATSGPNSGIFVSHSSDGGATWSDPVPVFLDTSGATFSDKPWIGVDTSSKSTAGSVYVAWNLDSNADSRDPDHAPATRSLHPRIAVPGVGNQGGMVVSHSTDGGATWSQPLVLLPFNDTQFAIGSIPQVGPDGRVSIVFLTSEGTNGDINHIEIVRSDDGGVTFSPAHIIATVQPLPNHLPGGTFRNISLPSFAVSPVDGKMLVVWSDMRNGDADVLASRSLDDGITWSEPFRVNNDKIGDGKDQFQPEVAVSRDGTFTAAWFDRRYDPKNRLIDEVVAQSTKGVKFGRNIRVTKKSWNPAIDAPRPEGKATNTFIGDYQGLAVDNHTVHPLWNDTQNGASQEIHTAVVSVRLFYAKTSATH